MNLKKLDEIDVVFIDQPFKKDEQEQFSQFLRNRKVKKESIAIRRRRTAKKPTTIIH